MKRNNTILIVIVIGLVFWRWLIPGNRVANDFPFASKLNLISNLSLPQTWSPEINSGLGGPTLSVLWSWPLNLAFGVGAKIGLSFSVLERMAVLGSLILGGLGILKLSSPAGVLIYLTNSFFILLIDGGQISLALSYGIMPWCICFYKQRNIDKFALSSLILSIFDIRFVYFLILLIGLDWIIFKKNIFEIIKIGLVTGVLILGFHAYWLLPAIVNRGVALPSGYTSTSQLDFLSFANWKHALFFQQPHWHENVFGKIGKLHREFVIFPILALMSIYMYRKPHEVWYWTIVLCISIFLAKGNTWPLGEVYTWLFVNLPGFNLFRDPVKFYFLIALAYSVLIGQIRHYKLFVAISIVVLWLNWPVISGKMTGTFSIPRLKKEYLDVNKITENDSKWSRTLWVSKRYPMGSSDYLHPLSEAVDLGRLRPFTAGTVGKYETVNYLREASYSGQLLNVLGVKYLVYPAMDPYRDNIKIENQLYHATFSGQLANLPWIKSVRNVGPVKLYETKSNQDLLFIPENTIYVVGSDDIYNTGLDLSKNALIFAEEHPGIRNNNYQIVLNRKSKLDYSITSISSNDFIFPALKLNNSPDSSDWWKRDTANFLWWRDFLQTKYGLDNQDFDYGGGLAISEGKNKLTLSVKEGILLARVMSSSRSGEIIFNQNDKKIGSINTLLNNPATNTIKLTGYKSNPNKYYKYSQAEFGWYEVGEVKSGFITISTVGDINVINVLAVLPNGEFPMIPIKPNEATVNQSARVEYNRISATHYKLKISGLIRPSMLVFSQSFDPLWKLDGKSPVKVYSLLNGFNIDRNGEYELFYEPQKQVKYGLIVTGFTTLLIIYFCFKK